MVQLILVKSMDQTGLGQRAIVQFAVCLIVKIILICNLRFPKEKIWFLSSLKLRSFFYFFNSLLNEKLNILNLFAD